MSDQWLSRNGVTMIFSFIRGWRKAVRANVTHMATTDGAKLLEFPLGELDELVKTTEQVLEEGHHTLLFCEQGHRRSALGAVLVLCALTGKPVSMIYHHIQRLRPIVSIEGDWADDMRTVLEDLGAMNQDRRRVFWPLPDVVYSNEFLRRFPGNRWVARPEASSSGGRGRQIPIRNFYIEVSLAVV